MALQNGQAIDAERIKVASIHWLRHSHAKGLAQAVNDGLDARDELANMGHDDTRAVNLCVDDEPLKRTLATSRARRTARWVVFSHARHASQDSAIKLNTANES